MEGLGELSKSTTIKYEKKSSIGGELTVQVGADYVGHCMGKAYSKLQKTAKIDGFRKGKVPLSIIRQRYKSRAIQDVFEKLVISTCHIASEKEKVSMVGEPRVKKTNWLHWEEGSPMEYVAEVELIPTPDLKKYEGLEISVKAPDGERIQKRMEEVIQNILEPKAELQNVDSGRGIRLGDIVVLDFQGKVGERDLPNASAQNFMVEVGSSQTLKEFQEGILGMRSGEEKAIKVLHPEDHEDDSIAGRTVVYATKIHEIKKKVYPELTDEIVKDFKASSVEEFKKQLRKKIEAEMEQAHRMEVEKELLHALVEANPMEVPKTLVRQKLTEILNNVERAMEKNKLDSKFIEKYMKKNINFYTAEAEREVKVAFLLPLVVEKIKVQVSEVEIEQKVQELAQSFQKKVEEIKAFFQDPKRRENLVAQISSTKAIEHVLEKAQIRKL